MQRFIQEKNLRLFLRRLLAEQTDMHEERRQVILGLLVEEANNAVEQESQRGLQAEE